MLHRWVGRVLTLLRGRTLEECANHLGGDGYQAGREGRCTGGVGESLPSSEDEHSRNVLTAWVGMGTRLGGMGAAQVGWMSPDPPLRTNTRGTC